MIECSFITTFPGIFQAVLQESILKRAQEKGYLKAKVINLRNYALDRHRTTDDTPYGGGAGMVMKLEPIFSVMDELMEENKERRVIVPSPQGEPFTHEKALELSQESKALVFICGHYEGIDERLQLGLPVEEISLGDYVLTGGELASLVMVDALVRLIPGVLGDIQSVECDSFSNKLLDFPHYTRPAAFRGMKVPEVLLSGNHEAIRSWRKKQTVLNTWKKRPDLLNRRILDDEEKHFLQEIQKENRCDPPEQLCC